MADPIPLAFSDLRTARSELNDFLLRHELSIRHFQHESDSWFYLTDDERLEEEHPPHRLNQADAEVPTTQTESLATAEVGPGVPVVRHLTTTASCIESLHDLREHGDYDDRFSDLVNSFAKGALSRGTNDWQSEAAAHVYCKVRALPAILDFGDLETLQENLPKITDIVNYAWGRVSDQPRHQGIFEYAPTELGETPGKKQNEYPPNTFLTYWGLRVLESLRRRGILTEDLERLRDKREIALLWSRWSLGAQVALHASESDRADPQQLAWALSTVIRFGEVRDVSTKQSIDVIRAGLRALFTQQRPAGNFPRGEPLFHYPAAGNAYCYTLETVADLLHLALDQERGEILRDLLRPYGTQLLTLWRWARADAQEIGTREKPAIGWCSAHHPYRTAPESWATAAAFHALEALRALIGVWAGDSAGRLLGVRKPKISARDLAVARLRDRANTWDPRQEVNEGGENVGALLGSLFINPILAREAEAAAIEPSPVRLDPDVPLVDSDQARSAILFGPPGTGKTTLVELLAGAIGWDFVEIIPSDFLAEGIDNVPKQADIIFHAVMELDHCVVLFDEADELIRDRSHEADPFGRFLTTSMLPKLAKLWEQRRVLFFLNTNWIDRADPAIKRSQRFDSAIFVLPPAFDIKKAAIVEALTDECNEELTRDKVEEALHGDGTDPLGWFALIRHDQLSELGAALRSHNGGAKMTDLKKELGRIGDQLSKSDWMPPPAKVDEPIVGPYNRYQDLARAQRRDFGRHRYVAIRGKIDELPDQYAMVYQTDIMTFAAIPPATDVPPVTLAANGWQAARDSILCYSLLRQDLPNAKDPEGDVA